MRAAYISSYTSSVPIIVQSLLVGLGKVLISRQRGEVDMIDETPLVAITGISYSS